MDKQKEQGLFWLSSNPGEKVDGAITLDDEHGTMLTAYGQPGLFNLESEEQQVIHGVAPVAPAGGLHSIRQVQALAGLA